MKKNLQSLKRIHIKNTMEVSDILWMVKKIKYNLLHTGTVQFKMNRRQCFKVWMGIKTDKEYVKYLLRDKETYHLLK